MYDSVCLAPGKVLSFPGGWTISYDAANTKMEFKQNAGDPAFVITPSGGNLHGTWRAESIISASDRRLKRGIEPLYRSLLRGRRDGRASPPPTRPGAQGRAEEEEPSEEDPSEAWSPMTASGLLARLRPSAARLLASLPGTPGDASLPPQQHQQRRSEDAAATATPAAFAFDAEDVERALPDVVRTAAAAVPGGGGGRKLVAYQDLLAVLALAAKERQRRLELHEAQEAAEVAELRRQGDLLDALESQAGGLLGRFARLRQLSFGGAL